MDGTSGVAAPMGVAAGEELRPAAANVARNFRSTDYARAADDWYVEPRWCVEQLADAIDFGGLAIWDPCCGGGTIPRVFADRFGEDAVVASDIVDRGYEGFDARWDAVEMQNKLVPGLPCSIVTNPPFKLAEQITRRALALTDHRVCVLQQLSFLASAGRYRLFTEFPPSDILILSKRPSMPPGHLIAEMGDKAFRGGTTDFCWIVWNKPHHQETRTRWLPPVMA